MDDTSKFNHCDLKLTKPKFEHILTDLIMDIEHFRKREIYGSAEPFLFFQLKEIFHTLESFGSARIEGNNTTLSELIESKIEGKNKKPSLSLREIENMEKAMRFIDETIKNTVIDRAYISELHKYVVNGLPASGEGDNTPGVYRTHDIIIKGSSHVPPSHLTVGSYMDEMLNFINTGEEGKYDLLKMAISHHRFMWIHPFGNGNGRTGRLFTYALLIKQGFTVNAHGTYIINPTAIFCNDRKEYYRHLSMADSNSEEGILNWCTYVLKGLKFEIEKIDRLLDIIYLRDEIILPAISLAHERKVITDIEMKILRISVQNQNQLLKAKDIKEIVPGKAPSEISRLINNLIKKEMLTPVQKGGRLYHMQFLNNFLLRSITQMLGKKGFLPVDYNPEKD